MIEERILEGWSREQIAGRFKLAGNSISHETIYRHIRLLLKNEGDYRYYYL